MPILTIWQVIKELAIAFRYYMEMKAKNLELDNVYKSQDREEKIHEEIIEAVVKKDKSRREGDVERVHYYESGKQALLRKLGRQRNITLMLMDKLHNREL